MLALVLAETAAALTLPLLALPVALDSQPGPTIHERVEIAVDREWLHVSAARDGGHAEARLKIGYYFGILAFDWVTTQYGQQLGTSLAGGGGEMNPLPLMGSGKGRAVGMAIIAAGWTVLDRALVAHGHNKTAKMLRFVLGGYGVSIVSWNLGLQRTWTPDMLIPSQWRRDASRPRDYSSIDAAGSGQTQRVYDACRFLAAHPAKHFAAAQCWK